MLIVRPFYLLIHVRQNIFFVVKYCLRQSICSILLYSDENLFSMNLILLISHAKEIVFEIL